MKRIRCHDCALKVNCIRKQRKESYEKDGIITYCVMAEPMRTRRNNDGRKNLHTSRTK